MSTIVFLLSLVGATPGNPDETGSCSPLSSHAVAKELGG